MNSWEIEGLLRPFGVDLNTEQMTRTLAYLKLLLHWNASINLTAIKEPRECVTRHFGEGMIAALREDINGCLLDIGSGAGFPSLAIKIVKPEVSMTLLEPVGKKRAFLKEVIQTCGFNNVDVLGQRLEQLGEAKFFDVITMRAVGVGLAQRAAAHLKRYGKLLLWLSKDQLDEVRNGSKGIDWRQIIDIPGTDKRVVLVGSVR